MIDETISDLTELKICGVVPFTKGTISGGNYKVITGDCLDEAISTMRKYQKIKQIWDEWHVDMSVKTNVAMSQIGEVLNDGKID